MAEPVPKCPRQFSLPSTAFSKTHSPQSAPNSDLISYCLGGFNIKFWDLGAQIPFSTWLPRTRLSVPLTTQDLKPILLCLPIPSSRPFGLIIIYLEVVCFFCISLKLPSSQQSDINISYRLWFLLQLHFRYPLMVISLSNVSPNRHFLCRDHIKVYQPRNSIVHRTGLVFAI